MKKLLLFFCSLFIIYSCTNGLNKSIIEPLTVDELKINMKRDTSFTDFYSMIQEIREYVLKSDVTQAKFADITYKRVKKYNDKINDAIFFRKIINEQREIYDSKFPDYTNEVDSILTYWQAYKSKYSLDSLVQIEYSELWKEYYSYSNDVKSVNIGFLITPLKGTIEQLIFRYSIKPKISNDGKLGYFDTHRCLASSPIYSAKTLYWEADYSDEKYLANKTSSEVSKEYAFNIEIVEVRMHGENMSEKLEMIPESVSDALKYGPYYNGDVIRELIDPNYVPFYEFSKQALNDAYKTIDSEVYTLFDEYYNDFYEDIDY